MGIDIGTTTISIIILDSNSGQMIERITQENRGRCYAKNNTQDADKIFNQVSAIVDELLDQYPDTGGIGITGQMHGILYLDLKGEAVSPLYTWQDETGNLPYRDKLSYAAFISELTGHAVSSGFGWVTHFYHAKNNLIHKKAVSFCTIGDYIAMGLCGLCRPIIHISNAASLGLYNIRDNSIDTDAVMKLQIESSFFPQVEKGNKIIGSCRGVPVSIAIGDNQASYIGSVRSDRSALINIGTGGQISCMVDHFIKTGYELRPYISDSYLLTYSSLCGGRAYAVLEAFFIQVLEMAGVKKQSLYEEMNCMIENLSSFSNPLNIRTLFDGTRSSPSERGMIENICLDNFTPQHLITGFLKGIADELIEPLKDFNIFTPIESLVCSGNTIRLNAGFQYMLSAMLDLPLLMTSYTEEASYGAGLFALLSAGYYSNINEMQQTIKYDQD